MLNTQINQSDHFSKYIDHSAIAIVKIIAPIIERQYTYKSRVEVLKIGEGGVARPRLQNFRFLIN